MRPICGLPRGSGFRHKSGFKKKPRKRSAHFIGVMHAAIRFTATRGMGRFENVSQQAGVEMGRWSWCSDFWDFDHDGYPDLYVANGYISAPQGNDLASFFWRQVVGKSPQDSTPSLGLRARLECAERIDSIGWLVERV